jgi:hypothetical protein
MPGPAGGGGRAGQPRDGDDTAVGTGEISGVVMVSGTGSPVRRGRVTLSGAELRGGRTAITDDQGRFTFQLLPAGRFSMTASKPGYVDVAYGAKRPGRPGTPVQLADGQRVDKLTIVIPRGGVITGVVVDENGEPAPGTQVRAMRYVMRTGERALTFSGQDQTDDRGQYRIFGQQPGDYVLSAVPRNLNPATDMRQLIMSQAAALQSTLGQSAQSGRGAAMIGNLGAMANSPGAQQAMAELAQQLGIPEAAGSVAYAPVYYPGTASPAGAAAITLGVGEERSGVDFQLQLVPTARVAGVVTSQDGTVPSNVQISLVPSSAVGSAPMEIGTFGTRVDGNGQFTFRDVTPGQYTLHVRSAVRRADAGGRGGPTPAGRGPVPPNQIAQVLWASADIAVSGQDLTDLQLVLQPGMAVTGRIQFRGTTSQAPSDLSSIRLTLSPRGQQNNPGPGGTPIAQVDEMGRFTFGGVPPGRYSVTANVAGRGGGQGASGSWTLGSVVVDGRDVLDFPLEIAPNGSVQGADVIFVDRTQELSGRIQDAMGRPTADFTIIVFPTDSRFWLPQARRILSTRPGTDGSFTLRGMPAGDYRITAVTDVEPGEWYDPAFLSQLVPASLPITLREGEQKVQDIKVAQ